MPFHHMHLHKRSQRQSLQLLPITLHSGGKAQSSSQHKHAMLVQAASQHTPCCSGAGGGQQFSSTKPFPINLRVAVTMLCSGGHRTHACPESTSIHVTLVAAAVPQKYSRRTSQLHNRNTQHQSTSQRHNARRPKRQQPLQNKCLCYLAGTSQVTWFVKDFLAGICKNDMQTWITQALIL
jgi:hypothetical protein